MSTTLCELVLCLVYCLFVWRFGLGVQGKGVVPLHLKDSHVEEVARGVNHHQVVQGYRLIYRIKTVGISRLTIILSKAFLSLISSFVSCQAFTAGN